jgi:DME family drug/metabolite transporter
MALYLGVATMGLANVLLTRGMRTLTPAPATTLMLTDPVVATVLGVVVLGESLVAVEAVGVLVLLAGLLLQGVLASRSAPGEPEPVPVL